MTALVRRATSWQRVWLGGVWLIVGFSAWFWSTEEGFTGFDPITAAVIIAAPFAIGLGLMLCPPDWLVLAGAVSLFVVCPGWMWFFITAPIWGPAFIMLPPEVMLTVLAWVVCIGTSIVAMSVGVGERRARPPSAKSRFAGLVGSCASVVAGVAPLLVLALVRGSPG